MAKKRAVSGKNIKDINSIANEQYNEPSGAQKQIDVGAKLIAIPIVIDGALTGTTDATTIKALPSSGRSVAVYNNDDAVGSITFGADATQTSQAVGAVDAVTGAVGIPCPPNAWTYLSAGEEAWVIASAVTLLVFLINDNSSLVQQAH